MGAKAIKPLLILGCVLLLIVGIYVKVSEDDEKPVIQIDDSEISYVAGQDTSILLQGVTAEDNRDGDLTDEVFVDQIIDLGDNSHAVVTYGVMDEANNVATARRKISYTGEKTDNTSVDNTQDGSSRDDSSTADNDKAPKITLSQNKLTINAGGAFNPATYIATAEDDTDSRSDLFKHIRVEGEYETATAGVYELGIYVTDNDGNRSNVEKFTLTVK